MRGLLSPMNIHLLHITLRENSKLSFLHLIKVLKKKEEIIEFKEEHHDELRKFSSAPIQNKVLTTTTLPSNLLRYGFAVAIIATSWTFYNEHKDTPFTSRPRYLLQDTGDDTIGKMCWCKYWCKYWWNFWVNINANIDADIGCYSQKIFPVELTYNYHEKLRRPLP